MDYEESPESWWNYTHSFLYKNFYRNQEEKIKSVLKFLKPKVVLDAGCGYGRYTKILKGMGFDVHSIDSSYKMIEKDSNFKLCSVENITYPNGFFDAVLCIDVVDHLKSLNLAIKEFNRILKQDGVLLLTVGIPGSPFILFNKAMRVFRSLFGRPPISRAYNDKNMKKILNGFDYFSVELLNYNIPTERLYVCKKKKIIFPEGLDDGINEKFGG